MTRSASPISLRSSRAQSSFLSAPARQWKPAFPLPSSASFRVASPFLASVLDTSVLAAFSGGAWRRARCPTHGRASPITHAGRGLFKQLPSPLPAGRYHSLAVELDESDAPHLMVTARSSEGEIMAQAHRHQPTYGVQFHPESVLRSHVAYEFFATGSEFPSVTSEVTRAVAWPESEHGTLRT